MIPSHLHQLGKITRLHGFKGELTVFLDTAVPRAYKGLDTIFLEQQGVMVPFEVQLLEQKTNKTVKLKLRGVDTEEAAKLLVNYPVFVDMDKLTGEDSLRVEMKSMVGYEVEDAEFGRVGTITQILELTGNPQIEIQHERGLVLLPLREEFIERVDDEAKKIYVNAPGGLIDLFIS